MRRSLRALTICTNKEFEEHESACSDRSVCPDVGAGFAQSALGDNDPKVRADSLVRQFAVITVRLLGGHLAGIRNYRDLSELGNIKPYSNVNEAIAFFKDDALIA
jgi:hypothetical protein